MILEQYPQQQLPQNKAEEQEQLLAIKDKKQQSKLYRGTNSQHDKESTVDELCEICLICYQKAHGMLFNVVNVVIGITSNA